MRSGFSKVQEEHWKGYREVGGSFVSLDYLNPEFLLPEMTTLTIQVFYFLSFIP